MRPFVAILFISIVVLFHTKYQSTLQDKDILLQLKTSMKRRELTGNKNEFEEIKRRFNKPFTKTFQTSLSSPDLRPINDETIRILSAEETRIMSKEENPSISSKEENPRILSTKENPKILPKEENRRILPKEESPSILRKEKNPRILPKERATSLLSKEGNPRILPKEGATSLLSKEENLGILSKEETHSTSSIKGTTSIGYYEKTSKGYNEKPTSKLSKEKTMSSEEDTRSLLAKDKTTSNLSKFETTHDSTKKETSLLSREGTTALLSNKEANRQMPMMSDEVGHVRVQRSLVDRCAMFATCDFMSKHIADQARYCHCDDNCKFFDDCCPEKQTNFSPPITPEHRFQCLSSGLSKVYGMMVATQCLSSHDEVLEMLCLNRNIHITGPWVMDEIGQVYKNKYCAQCNNVTLYNFFSVILLDIQPSEMLAVLNMTKTDKLNIVNLSNATVQFIPPVNKIPRSCMLFKDYDNSSEMCDNYGTNPVQTRSGIYRNVFCTTDSEPWMKCALGISDSRTVLNLYPLTVLFTFSRQKNEIPVCGLEDIDFCLDLEVYKYYKVDIAFKADIEGIPQENTMLGAVFTFFWSLFVKNFSAAYTMYTHYVITENRTELFLWGTIVLTQTLHWHEIKRYETTIQNVTRNITTINNVTGETIHINFQKSNASYASNVPAELYYYDIQKNGTFDFHLDEIVSMIRPTYYPRTFCPVMLIINHLPEIGKKFIISSIECNLTTRLSPSYNIQTSGLINVVKISITYVGFFLSIVCLIGLIVVNRKYNKHKTIAGGNSENIYISQLFSLVLFVIGIGLNNYFLVCKIISVLLPYSFLTMFSFKSIAVVCIASKIRKLENIALSITNNRSKSRIYLRILGLLMPLLCVVPMMMLDHLKILPYSEEEQLNICFPTLFPVNLFFVTGPIMVLIFINTACLLCTIIHIRKTKFVHALPASSLSRKSYSEALVYLRFTLLSGLPWVLGIMTSVVQSDTLDFIFIIACSLQGVFFLVSNVTSRSFRQHFRSVKATGKDMNIYATRVKEETF